MTEFDTCASHFTNKERDAETGNDFFGARYYNSATGRFLSPDPISIKANRLAHPQRLNLYNYALNNPLANIDPDGMDTIAISFQSSYYAGAGRIIGNHYWSPGHAGMVNINSSGAATYYDKNGTGVHKESLGIFALGKDGHLPAGDTGKILQRLSKEHGEGGGIKSLYIGTNDAEVNAMNGAGDRRAANNEKYYPLAANCAGFVESMLTDGNAVDGHVPLSDAETPNGMISQLFDEREKQDEEDRVEALPDLKDDSDASEKKFEKQREDQKQQH